MTQLQTQFRAARRVSTPLIAIKTPDQAMTLEALKSAVSNGTAPPILVWDCIRGCQWANQPGLLLCWRVLLGKETEPAPTRADQVAQARKELAMGTGDLTVTLEQANAFPEGTLRASG
jgi:hypothetical protein